MSLLGKGSKTFFAAVRLTPDHSEGNHNYYEGLWDICSFRARRALRVRPDSLAIDGDGEDVLVRFELPAGSYATVVVEELFGPVEDASRAAASGVC